MLLHKLAPFERANVFTIKRKPFAVSALVPEPAVPVGLDTFRVIGFNSVNCGRLLWKLNRQFALSPPQSICPTDLEVLAKLREIHESHGSRLSPADYRRLRHRGAQNRQHVGEFLPFFTKLTRSPEQI